jgi:RsiW-degrading membrane proteinase PrsW (M82 family)
MDKFLIILFSFLPALTYAFIVYVIMPYKSINLRDAARFLIGGMFSIIVLKYMHVFNLDSTVLFSWVTGVIDTKDVLYQHYFYFISVALLEELAKLMTFLIFFKLMNLINKEGMHPISIMFYSGMVGLGFAISENIEYAEGSFSPFVVLWWRSAAPVLTHMTCGFFMGYWLSLSNIGPKIHNRSLFDIIIHKRKRLNKIIFGLAALFSATILHGVYNLHLELNGVKGLSGAYILIILSSLGVLFCFDNIYKLYKNKLEENNAKETPKEELNKKDFIFAHQEAIKSLEESEKEDEE